MFLGKKNRVGADHASLFGCVHSKHDRGQAVPIGAANGAWPVMVTH